MTKTVLIAEDEPHIVELLTFLLEQIPIILFHSLQL